MYEDGTWGAHGTLAQNETCVLIAIRVTMAPVPVMMLVPMLPVLVRNIRVMAFLLVVPVGTVFAVIPVVVVMVMRVVDANLDMGFLCRRRGHDGTADREGSRQKESANK
jgi:hypothetical protein